jgi:hypothetical protein
MIKLKNLLPESFGDDFKKKNHWIQLPKDAVKKYADEIVDLIVNAYSAKGGNFELQSVDDIKKSDLDFWVANDVDADPEMDTVLAGKHTPAGTKMTVIGQDGGSAAKRSGIIQMVQFMKLRGFYAELDKELAAKLNMPYIKDEEEIRKVLNKDIKMNPDGSYDRKLTAGPVKTKVLVGMPKV